MDNVSVRAVVYDRYGPPEVLHFEEVPRPVPKDDEVLIKAHAVGAARADCETRAASRYVDTAQKPATSS